MSLTATFTDLPPPVLPARWDGQRLEATFRVDARFEGEPSEVAQGAFRLFVRGYFRADGELVRHYLCRGVLLSPTEFHEDGCPPPVCSAFGYRTCPPVKNQLTESLYLDADHEIDMRDGPIYNMRDQPGISGQPGMRLEMNLEYRAVLLDEDTSKELAAHQWLVQGTAVVPTSIGSEGPTVMDSGRTINAELTPDGGGGWDASLSISGDRGGGPAEPPAIRFQAEDANGNTLGILRTERNVVNVGSPRNQTWVIRFGVAPGQGRPERLTGALDDEEFSIQLVERHA